MKLIDQKSIDLAFTRKDVNKVVVHNISEREWYFTFEATDPLTGTKDIFAMETQRGGLRLWADPRLLFDFLYKRGVNEGQFKLNEKGIFNESTV